MPEKTYILAPDWYPRQDNDPVLSLGTVYSDPMLRKDASRRWSSKGDLKTLPYNSEKPGEIKIKKDANWELQGWIKFLDSLKIAFSRSKAEEISITFKWSKIEKVEIHPEVDLSVYCNNLVKQDIRTFSGETMSEVMRLGRRKKASLWIVSGIQYATDLEIWVDQRKHSSSIAELEGKDPHSGAGGGASKKNGAGEEFYCERKLEGEVIFACQVHEITPMSMFRDTIKTRLSKTGTALKHEEAEIPDRNVAEDNRKVEVVEAELLDAPEVIKM